MKTARFTTLNNPLCKTNPLNIILDQFTPTNNWSHTCALVLIQFHYRTKHHGQASALSFNKVKLCYMTVTSKTNIKLTSGTNSFQMEKKNISSHPGEK
jgi:hypothetical protein